jgi:methylenetetrahydrofolate dehydrogenase (NADP+) / methenyltetrahydrofolate cyclohydrolase
VIEQSSAVRNKIIGAVKQLSDTSRIGKQFHLFSLLEQLEEFKKASTIGLFVGKDHEPSTLSFIKKCLDQGKKVCLPKIVGKNLEFRRIYNIQKDLIIGPYNIFEPSDICKLVRPHNIHLLCIPAVAVDDKGNRIGRGGGYYDRYLERSPIKKSVALVYENQVVSELQVKDHDQPIDMILTDQRVIRCVYRKPTKLLNGIKIADQWKKDIAYQIQKFSTQLQPSLKVILIGNNPASIAYVSKKKKACQEVGIVCNVMHFSNEVSQEALLHIIKKLNQDENVHGILVQLPLPKEIDSAKIINAISPTKDVDGLTEISKERFLLGAQTFHSCAPAAIIKLLKECTTSLKRKMVALVGYGNLIGKPLHRLLLNEGASVIICTYETKHVATKTRKADIIISATGVPHLISVEHVKNGAIVIDAGFGKIDGYCVGDVQFDEVFSKVSYITPSPGGVGPMTIAMLLSNVLNAMQLKH